jgi:hypothetical protein
MRQLDIFGNAIELKQQNSSYIDFVDKFERKLTTDDCYTPINVYDTVVSHIKSQVDINSFNIVRPFYPNSDYKQYQYKENDIVIDNPPFSIMAEILEFYTRLNIKFYLFASHLTLFANNKNCTSIVVGANIIYENKANVITSFCSNLYGDLKIFGDSCLYKKLSDLNIKVGLPKYTYPNELLTVSRLSKLVKQGFDIKVFNKEAINVNRLDSQGKDTIFGKGYLISPIKAAEIKAAEIKVAEIKAAEIKAAENRIEFKLSEREIKLINQL